MLSRPGLAGFLIFAITVVVIPDQHDLLVAFKVAPCRCAGVQSDHCTLLLVTIEKPLALVRDEGGKEDEDVTGEERDGEAQGR